MKICSHIHTHHSHDCVSTVEDILEKAIELQYDALIITDHNTTKGAYEALNKAEGRIQIIIAAEFGTEVGHILAIDIDDSIERTCLMKDGKYDFNDLVKKVREQNGLLFLAHPIQSRAKFNHDFIQQLDGIELINSRVESSFVVKKSKELNQRLIEKYQPSIISGCDAHTVKELEGTYMEFTSENRDFINIKELLLGDKILYSKRPSYKLIAWNKLTQNKGKSIKFYTKQIIKMTLGIFIDMKIAVGGNQFVTIRICKEDQ